MCRLSVVIVTWNSSGVIGKSLASLVDVLPDAESTPVILIDNASSDDTIAKASAALPSVRLMANATNRGLAAANNQGLRATGSNFVLISNPDVEYRPGAVAAMLAVMDRHPEAGWVVPRLLHEDGSLQTSAGDLPSLTETLLGRQAARRRSSSSTSGFWWDGWAHDEERRIGRGHECAYLVRRAAIDAAGLQDERYFLDWEGVDWTDRFREAGWETWLAPEAEVVHHGGTSIRQVPVRSALLAHWGMFLYFSSRKPWYWTPPLAVAFLIRALAKIGLQAAGVPMYRLAIEGGKR